MNRLAIVLLFLTLFASCTEKDADKTDVQIDQQQFVEIAGKKQFYLSKGEGNPVVVFVTGLGPTMDDFQDLQKEVSKHARTICYDRAGIGNSETFNNERNLENAVLELKELVEKIGLDKPFILVGHSRGGLIARYFVSKYPEMVCGLVLIDPAIPEHKWKKRQLRTADEQIGFDAYYNSFCTDSTLYSATIRNEFKHSFTTDSAFVAGKGFPLSIPITIIGSTKTTDDKYSKEETAMKVELLNGYLDLNPQIKLIFTDKSGHYIYDTEPELVINEIVTMIDNIKAVRK